MEKWRDTSNSAREEFYNWVDGKLRDRAAVGVAKYSDGSFVGDPLIQLEEEALDMLFYVYWAKRQRQYIFDKYVGGKE